MNQEYDYRTDNDQTKVAYEIWQTYLFEHTRTNELKHDKKEYIGVQYMTKREAAVMNEMAFQRKNATTKVPMFFLPGESNF